MAILKRSEITPPAVPTETVAVAALGGDVQVRGLLLGERLALFAEMQEPGSKHTQVSRLLALCVIDADGQPIMDETGWERFGASSFEATLELFAAVQRVSGLVAEAVEKN